MLEAIIWAKRKKEDFLKKKEIEERQEQNRRMLIEKQWSFEQTKGYMLYRSANLPLFNGKFEIDSSNEILFDTLCYYFSNDDRFIQSAISIGVESPSLTKGIMLAGNCGVGKTWMVKLFQKNQRQIFVIRNAKVISDGFEENGQEYIDEYCKPIQNAFQDISCFLQKESGLCIDDIGTEDVKNHYGNKKNVVGDIIEKRYSNGHVGIMLHATTNFSSDQLKSFYGERVTSRMREIFNFFDLGGDDRRK